MDAEGKWGIKDGIQSKAGVNWNDNVNGALWGMLKKTWLLNFERQKGGASGEGF